MCSWAKLVFLCYVPNNQIIHLKSPQIHWSSRTDVCVHAVLRGIRAWVKVEMCDYQSQLTFQFIIVVRFSCYSWISDCWRYAGLGSMVALLPHSKKDLVRFLLPLIQDSNNYMNPKGKLLCLVTAALKHVSAPGHPFKWGLFLIQF